MSDNLSLGARLRHIWLALRMLPVLLFSRRRRALLARMRTFNRLLPEKMRSPLPLVMAGLLAERPDRQVLQGVNTDEVRNLADLAALLERRSPLGLCLRRSLTRYHYLRTLGLPVEVYFGVRVVGGQADRKVGGHAWLVLGGEPYYEDGENWRGFTVMLRYPQAEAAAGTGD